MPKAQLLKNVLLSVLLPLSLGILAILPVITSENGYVAGFVFLPLIILILLASLGLLIASLIATGINGRRGLWVLLSGPMLLCGFFGGAMVAKQFEIGAYREDPMVHFPAELTNIVLFKPGTTNQQINEFLDQTISSPHEGGGTWPLPGIQSMGNIGKYEHFDAVSFDFFETSTEEQRQYVYDRVESSPFVSELRKNVQSKDYMPTSEPLSENQSQNTKKAVTINSTTTSR